MKTQIMKPILRSNADTFCGREFVCSYAKTMVTATNVLNHAKAFVYKNAHYLTFVIERRYIYCIMHNNVLTI